MSAHLTEEEQIETFKRWWKENGGNTVAVIVIALAGYFGWQGWQTNQQAKREGASALFQQLAELAVSPTGEALNEQQLVEVSTLGEQIKDQYGSSYYAVNAALLLAKIAAEQDNLAAAASQLQWAEANNDDPAIGAVITQRYARVLLAQGSLDSALALVQTAPLPQFTSSFAEVRGDVLAAKDDKKGAYYAYQEALTSLPSEQSNRRQLVELKRDQYVSDEFLVEAE